MYDLAQNGRKVSPRAGKMTPQAKLITVNDHYGNPMLAKQQGSTIEKFDMVELDPTKTTYEFFKNAKMKDFPLTNLQEGKLQAQESFILTYAYFSLSFFDEASNTWITQRPIAAGDAALLMGTLEFRIENEIVIKELPLRSWLTPFNNSAENFVDTVYDFKTKIALLPLLNFQGNIQFPTNFFTVPQGQKAYLGLTIGGPGAIFSAKGGF